MGFLCPEPHNQSLKVFTQKSVLALKKMANLLERKINWISWYYIILTLCEFLQLVSVSRSFISVESAGLIPPFILTVRFMKLKNFFSISVMMEKSPFGRCSLTVVTFTWGAAESRMNTKMRTHIKKICNVMILSSPHLAALAEAAQQQSSVGGNDAVFHMLPCMLQSWIKTQKMYKTMCTYRRVKKN